MSLMRTLDAGTMGNDVGPWPFLLAMFVVTLGGVFIVGTLIGILTTGLEGKLEELRKGRSWLVEEGHTVILGWTLQIFTLLSELVVANANKPRSCIAILADRDKVAMEDELRSLLGPTGRTRIVCWSGDPLEMNDLQIVGINESRAIIVLPTAGPDPDAEVIKTLLAVTNNLDRRPQPYHIVAEIRDAKNLSAASLAGHGEAERILASQLIARIIAQTCRQSGLSVVYSELLGFASDEIYFHEEPALVGRTFDEALFAYEDSALMWLVQDGQAHLNPPMDTRIRLGDQVIAISEDDDTVRLSGLQDVEIRHEAIQSPPAIMPQPEHTLILGWNARAPFVVNELEQYVAEGSELAVVADYPGVEEALAHYCSGLRRLKVSCLRGDTTDRGTLDGLGIEAFHHVILLCYCDTLDRQQADARTLVTLLHLREISERYGHPFSIVSELLDERNRNLAEVTRADDFIVSDRITSLLLAQISENKRLNAVFADLFDAEGSEIYLKPAGHYVRLHESVNFYTVVEAGRRRGEVALGYRLHAFAQDASRFSGVVLNPDKSRTVTFDEADRVIVLAEN
ncbi:MAG: CASTOR/POLLUX-related putative ion channel [Chloroflexia bacterium]